jgi:hypothetical protein
LIKSISILSFLLLHFFVIGQIEITSNPFKFDSDTKLRYKIDFIDKEIVENKGTNQNWNLKNIESPLFSEINIDVNNSTAGQNLRISEKNYVRSFKRNKSNLDETGITVKLNSSQYYNFQYNKPISFSYKNLKYGAKYSEKTTFEQSLNKEELPARMQRSLPEKVKNIKMIGTITRFYHCDASGRFILEEKNVSALRMKVIEKVELRIYDMYTGSEISVNDNNALNLIFPGNGTNVYYLFFSNSTKIHFARIRPNKNNDDYVIEYQSNIDISNNYNIYNNTKELIIYPNPNYGITKINLSGFTEGSYSIDIYNIIGKKVWSKIQNMDSESIFKIDFSFLRKGTYLLSIKDKAGNTISTKKLVIIGV